MLAGPDWNFIHVPKCGGTAVRNHLYGDEVGDYLPLGNLCAIKSDWHRITKRRPKGRVCMVVRHPALWLRSFYLNQAPRRVKVDRFLHSFWADDVDGFVENVCKGRPGYVGEMYRAYMRWPSIKVFRLEDGLDNVIEWLGGQPTIVKAFNVSPSEPTLSDRSFERVAQVEASTLRQFGYEPWPS